MGERIKKEIKSIDYRNTKNFFESRAGKFNADNPYSVTMYQDNHPELVIRRNAKEIETILPLLKLDGQSRVLDVACGIGRWSDAIQTNIAEYCGVDFSESLIEIAKSRNASKEDRIFLVGSVSEIETVLSANDKGGGYNRILLMGILMYLNDRDVQNTMLQIERVCGKHAVICVREPIGIKERLTLCDIFSDELNDYYSAVYRSGDELRQIFRVCLLDKGFNICKEGFLFEDALNNRTETAQYFWIFER